LGRTPFKHEWIASNDSAGAAAAGAQQVTLAWDASVSTNVAGCQLYYGTNSRA